MTAGDHFNPENRKHGFLAGQSKLQEVLNRKTLIVGTGSTNPPWHFEDAQGNLVGMDIDLARLVARQLLTEAKFR